MKVYVTIEFHVEVKDQDEADLMVKSPEMTPEAWLKLREHQAFENPDGGYNFDMNVSEAFNTDNPYDEVDDVEEETWEGETDEEIEEGEDDVTE